MALLCMFSGLLFLSGSYAVFGDGAEDCGIYLNEMKGSTPAPWSRIMKYKRCETFAVISSIWSCHVRSCEIVGDLYVVYRYRRNVWRFLFLKHAHFLCLVVVQRHVVGGSPLCHFVCLERVIGA